MRRLRPALPPFWVGWLGTGGAGRRCSYSLPSRRFANGAAIRAVAAATVRKKGTRKASKGFMPRDQATIQKTRPVVSATRTPMAAAG